MCRIDILLILILILFVFIIFLGFYFLELMLNAQIHIIPDKIPKNKTVKDIGV